MVHVLLVVGLGIAAAVVIASWLNSGRLWRFPRGLFFIGTGWAPTPKEARRIRTMLEDEPERDTAR